MTIGGISGNRNNSYQYQNMVNMLRLNYSYKQTQTQSPVQPVEKTGAVSRDQISVRELAASSTKAAVSNYSSMKDSVDSYSAQQTKLENAVSVLKSDTRTNVFNTYDVASTDEKVASVSKNGRLRSDTDLSLKVNRLASEQKNSSMFSNALAKPGSEADMNFTIQTEKGSAQISVGSQKETGALKTIQEMYGEAADAINSQSALGIRATVEQGTGGTLSLAVSGTDTGEKGRFAISGKMGAASGMEKVSVEARNASFTVTNQGITREMTSSGNSVSLDNGRIQARLEGEGETQIYTGIDADKVVSAVKDLADSYNGVQSLLEKNTGRGIAAGQLSAFRMGQAEEKALNAAGISYDKSGKMKVDEEALQSALSKNFEGTRELIGGQSGLAERAKSKTQAAMSDSLRRIAGDRLFSSSSADSKSTLPPASLETNTNHSGMFGLKGDGFRYFSSFARGGTQSLGNYYTVGMLFNALA